MDHTQAPNEIQGPNMDQKASHETRTTNGTPGKEILTPFGSRMNPASASLLAQNRLAWHLHYWRDLQYWGTQQHNVDPVLLELLIEVEQMLKLDPQLRREMRQPPAKTRFTIYDESMWFYNEADRDIDCMLANKGHKIRVYLRNMEPFMLESMRAGDTDTAGPFFRKMADLYRRLRAEEERDAERRADEMAD